MGSQTVLKLLLGLRHQRRLALQPVGKQGRNRHRVAVYCIWSLIILPVSADVVCGFCRPASCGFCRFCNMVSRPNGWEGSNIVPKRFTNMEVSFESCLYFEIIEWLKGIQTGQQDSTNSSFVFWDYISWHPKCMKKDLKIALSEVQNLYPTKWWAWAMDVNNIPNTTGKQQHLNAKHSCWE